MSMKVIRNQPL